MYFRSPDRVAPADGGAGAAFAMSFAALLVVVLGVYPGPLVQRVNEVLPSDSISLPTDVSGSAVGSPHQLPGQIAEARPVQADIRESQ